MIGRLVAITLCCAILFAPILCICATAAKRTSGDQRHACCKAPKRQVPERSKCPHCGQAKEILAVELTRSSIAAPAVLSLSSHSIALSMFTPQMLHPTSADPPRVLLDLFHSACLLTI